MDLTKKFQEATSSYAVNIRSLELGRQYSIIHAERVITKFGPTVLRSISSHNIVKVYMPKHYSAVFSDEDIESINSHL